MDNVHYVATYTRVNYITMWILLQLCTGMISNTTEQGTICNNIRTYIRTIPPQWLEGTACKPINSRNIPLPKEAQDICDYTASGYRKPPGHIWTSRVWTATIYTTHVTQASWYITEWNYTLLRLLSSKCRSARTEKSPVAHVYILPALLTSPIPHEHKCQEHVNWILGSRGPVLLGGHLLRYLVPWDWCGWFNWSTQML